VATSRRRPPQPTPRRHAGRGAVKPALHHRRTAVEVISPPLRVMVISGPNLDRLGRREPSIYGTATLDDIHRRLENVAQENGAVVDCRQSNHEGDLLDWIGQSADGAADGILINPGALTHTSYALYDAVRSALIPTIEVHLSNPYAREEFRRKSLIAPACLGKVAGFGAMSYQLALIGLLDHLRTVAQSRPIVSGQR
jgi:3-dehydroquinate dehydratase II